MVLEPHCQPQSNHMRQADLGVKLPHMSEKEKSLIARRIEQRLEALGLSASAASSKAGLSRYAISNIQKNPNSVPRGQTLLQLARALETTPEYLLTGERDHIPSEEVAAGIGARSEREHFGASSLEKYLGKVPEAVPEIDAKAGAGNGTVGEHEVVTLRRGEAFVGHKVVSEWVFPSTFLRHELRMQPGEIMVLEVVGDSMSPSLESGDRVLVDTTYAKPTPDGIYVIEEGDGPMVKRLQLVRRSDPPQIRIISDNKHHEPYTLRLDEIRIIGRVSGRVTKM